MNETNEFSFLLRPSDHGVGVFAVHDIAKGVHLRLFGDKETIDLRSIERTKGSVPEVFRDFCMDRGDKLVCPQDFGHMHVGWYLNHSKDSNTYRDTDYKWYSAREIKAGEEIFIDYNSLEEPTEAKADYYKN
jgi:hypothetical protein